MTLHLLRNMPPHINGEPVDFPIFRRLVRRWGQQPDTVFGSWTRRAPRRVKELVGGSVYYVVSKEIRFRMPLVRIESVQDFQPPGSGRAAVCRPYFADLPLRDHPG